MIKSFDEYYRHYLSMHQNRISRRLHLVGWPLGSLSLLLICYSFEFWWTFFAAVAIGYSCAWVGHIWFERNKPATWRNPVLAYVSEVRMVWDICRGRIPL